MSSAGNGRIIITPLKTKKVLKECRYLPSNDKESFQKLMDSDTIYSISVGCSNTRLHNIICCCDQNLLAKVPLKSRPSPKM